MARKSRGCAEAYMGTPHKQDRRLTPPRRKRTLSGWKLAALRHSGRAFEPESRECFKYRVTKETQHRHENIQAKKRGDWDGVINMAEGPAKRYGVHWSGFPGFRMDGWDGVGGSGRSGLVRQIFSFQCPTPYSLGKNQWAKPRFDLFKDFGRQGVEMLGIPSPPVNTFDMVGKDRSFKLESLGYLHLKGVALRLHGDRDYDSEPHDPIIVVRRQDKRRSPSSLLVTPHGI